MQTGIVQPSGPSTHFWFSFGSVWARYTASGGAANRLVTSTWVLPSVFRVNLLIVFLLFLSSFYLRSLVVPCRREPRPAGCSSSPALFATLRATGPLLQCRPLRDDEAASCHPPDQQQVLRLGAPSGVGRLPVASSRRAGLVPSQSLRPWRDVQGLPDVLDRPRRKRRHRDSASQP